MKLFIILISITLIGAVRQPVEKISNPIQQNQLSVDILEQQSDIRPDGSYAYRYALSDGTSAEQSADPNNNVNGNFQYISSNGENIYTQYIADENGFQAFGSHLPVAPETPAYVIRLLEHLAIYAKSEAELKSDELARQQKQKQQGNRYKF